MNKLHEYTDETKTVEIAEAAVDIAASMDANGEDISEINAHVQGIEAGINGLLTRPNPEITIAQQDQSQEVVTSEEDTIDNNEVVDYADEIINNQNNLFGNGTDFETFISNGLEEGSIYTHDQGIHNRIDLLRTDIIPIVEVARMQLQEKANVLSEKKSSIENEVSKLKSDEKIASDNGREVEAEFIRNQISDKENELADVDNKLNIVAKALSAPNDVLGKVVENISEENKEKTQEVTVIPESTPDQSDIYQEMINDYKPDEDGDFEYTSQSIPSQSQEVSMESDEIQSTLSQTSKTSGVKYNEPSQVISFNPDNIWDDQNKEIAYSNEISFEDHTFTPYAFEKKRQEYSESDSNANIPVTDVLTTFKEESKKDREQSQKLAEEQSERSTTGMLMSATVGGAVANGSSDQDAKDSEAAMRESTKKKSSPFNIIERAKSIFKRNKEDAEGEKKKGSLLETVTGFLGGIGNTISGIPNLLKTIGTVVGVGGLLGILTGALGEEGLDFNTLFTNIGSFASKIWDWAKKDGLEIVKGIGNFFVEHGEEIWKGFQDFSHGVIDFFKDHGEDIWKFIQGTWNFFVDIGKRLGIAVDYIFGDNDKDAATNGTNAALAMTNSRVENQADLIIPGKSIGYINTDANGNMIVNQSATTAKDAPFVINTKQNISKYGLSGEDVYTAISDASAKKVQRLQIQLDAQTTKLDELRGSGASEEQILEMEKSIEKTKNQIDHHLHATKSGLAEMQANFYSNQIQKLESQKVAAQSNFSRLQSSGASVTEIEKAQKAINKITDRISKSQKNLTKFQTIASQGNIIDHSDSAYENGLATGSASRLASRTAKILAIDAIGMGAGFAANKIASGLGASEEDAERIGKVTQTATTAAGTISVAIKPIKKSNGKLKTKLLEWLKKLFDKNAIYISHNNNLSNKKKSQCNTNKIKKNYKRENKFLNNSNILNKRKAHSSSIVHGV